MFHFLFVYGRKLAESIGCLASRCCTLESKWSCVLVSSGVSAVDVVGLMDWDGVDRGMVDWSRDGVSRDMVNRGMVDRSSVGRLVVMVGTRVLWGGGACLVRPGVVWEPGGVGEVLAGGRKLVDV